MLYKHSSLMRSEAASTPQKQRRACDDKCGARECHGWHDHVLAKETHWTIVVKPLLFLVAFLVILLFTLLFLVTFLVISLVTFLVTFLALLAVTAVFFLLSFIFRF